MVSRKKKNEKCEGDLDHSRQLSYPKPSPSHFLVFRQIPTCRCWEPREQKDARPVDDAAICLSAQPCLVLQHESLARTRRNSTKKFECAPYWSQTTIDYKELDVSVYRKGGAAYGVELRSAGL